MLREDLQSEFNALLPGRSTEAGATRRTALKAALGVGYAASTLPIMAQTAIKTSSEGLTAGEVTIDVNGFKMAAVADAAASAASGVAAAADATASAAVGAAAAVKDAAAAAASAVKK